MNCGNKNKSSEKRFLMDLLSILKPLRIAGSTSIYTGNPCTDSRKIKPGDIFVAIKGNRTDGHNFIAEAIQKGASVIIYDNEKILKKQLAMVEPEKKPLSTLIEVENTASILPLLAASYYGFPSSFLKLIGITGTNGKTTTSILIQSILLEAGFSVGRIGTLGYCWGSNYVEAPLTTPDLCMLHSILHQMVIGGVNAAVMEVSSHALHQHRVAGCLYDVAVFTNLSQDHLDYHRSMEEYFSAKARLFTDYLATNGTAAINADDPWGAKLLEVLKKKDKEVKVVTYGIENPDATIRACEISYSPEGLNFEVELPDKGPSSECKRRTYKISSGLVGRLNVYNILAAIAAVKVFNIPEELIFRGIQKITRVDGRLERISTSNGFAIIVDYAHTPDAMEKALSCVREWTRGRLIVVFGCGGDRDRTKRPMMARVASEFADFVIITSDNPRTEPPERIIEDIVAGMPPTWQKVDVDESFALTIRSQCYAIEADRRRAIDLAVRLAGPDDTVFIGGKGHETYQIIGHEKIPFDDRLVAMECLNKHHRIASADIPFHKCKE